MGSTAKFYFFDAINQFRVYQHFTIKQSTIGPLWGEKRNGYFLLATSKCNLKIFLQWLYSFNGIKAQIPWDNPVIFCFGSPQKVESRSKNLVLFQANKRGISFLAKPSTFLPWDPKIPFAKFCLTVVESLLQCSIGIFLVEDIMVRKAPCWRSIFAPFVDFYNPYQ